MKILIYAWSLSNGGAERVAALWANGFDSENYDVSLVLGSFLPSIDYKVSNEVKILSQSSVIDGVLKLFPCCVKKSRMLFKLVNGFFCALPDFIQHLCLSRVIKKVSPDVIIVVMQGQFDKVKGALTQCGLKIPIIVTDHNAYERPDYAPFTKQRIEQKFVNIKKYDYMTVLTEADRRVLIDNVDENILKKTFVLPNPLAFKPLDSLPQKQKFILAAGRLDDWHYKGFDLLLKAWAYIEKDFSEWKLKIAGGGDQSFLQKMCFDMGIENRVQFLGFVDMKDYYSKAEIFVLSSRYEGFGLVLIEAMSQGCACIACDYKGRQREIITDDSQGIICPPDNELAIADALKKLILDENLRRDLQKNAIERSKYYELPNIMQRWNCILDEIGLKGSW